MPSKTVVVPNISCNHCTHTIEMEVSEMEGISSVAADLDSKRVTVTWNDPADWDQIEALLKEINYPPAQTLQVE
jgi:copper chaperone CopZ